MVLILILFGIRIILRYCSLVSSIIKIHSSLYPPEFKYLINYYFFIFLSKYNMKITYKNYLKIFIMQIIFIRNFKTVLNYYKFN